MLTSISLQEGASFSATGGTAVTLDSYGSSFNENRMFIDNGTSIADQSKLNFVYRPATPNKTGAGGYSQARRSCLIAVPETIGDEIVYHTLKIELSSDRRATDAVVTKLLGYAASVVTDSEASSFWEDGSTR